MSVAKTKVQVPCHKCGTMQERSEQQIRFNKRWGKNVTCNKCRVKAGRFNIN